jgi:superfamily I DNA/RNA helicase
MANALIAHNTDWIAGRVLVERADNGPGEVALRQYDTASSGEADAVATKITALIEQGVDPSEIIVLAQRSTFAAPIFEKLKGRNIPVKSYYAEAQLDSVSAQERFALLKLFINNEDRVALRWLLGCRHHNWHSSQYARLIQRAKADNTSPWITLERLAAGAIAVPHTGALVDRFNEIRVELANLGQAADVDDFIQLWLPPNPETELLAEAVVSGREEATTIPELYEVLYATITEPEVPLEVKDVRIMSLHKAKGLNSAFVFIVGCVEGLLPARPDPTLSRPEQAAKLREDRRLFYVGVTRVKSLRPRRAGYLALTYAQTMLAADAYRSQIKPVHVAFGVAHLQASRFIGEMAPHAPAARYNTPL